MNLPILILVWILSLVGAASFSYGKGYHNGNLAVQQKWDLQAKQLAEQHAADEAAARRNEQQAQQTADRLQKERNEAYKKIASLDAALRDSLRNRPERPAKSSGVPSNAGTCAAASGAELARGDGEFLAGYSSDAAKLQKEFDHCVAQYNEVKKQINKD